MMDREALTAKIKELSQLDPVEYALSRKDEAKAIGIGVIALDKLVKDLRAQESDNDSISQFEGWAIEQYSEPVNGSKLFDEIFQTFEKFVIADKESLEIASMWVALTWLTDVATVLPMAMITAPEKGCGKTVFLSVIEKLVRRPLQVCNVTPAALFRSVQAWEPTLLVDEADTFFSENEGLRGILNSGHTKGSAYVVRCEEIKGNIQPVRFSTWGAKAISGIKLETLHSTLTSRSIMLPLRRKKPEENTQNIRHATPEQFELLKQKLFRWTSDNCNLFVETKPELPELKNRDADNWEPLLAIAKLAGEEWFTRIKHAALKIVGKIEESPSLEEELLRDIKNIFDCKRISRISTVNLLEALADDDLAAWGTYNRGQPMKPRQLANRLKSYDIYPKPLKINGVAVKGYDLSDFEDVFERYVFSSDTPKKSVTSYKNPETSTSSNPEAVTHELPVTDLAVTAGYGVTDEKVTGYDKVTQESFIDADCNRITDNLPKSGEGKKNNFKGLII
jgi:putative DNA primase/helicase